MMTSEMRPCIQRRCRRKVCIAGGHGESYVNLALPHLKMKCIKISYFADHNNGIDNFVTRIYTIPGICTYFKISAVDRNVSERLMKPRIESTTCCKVPSLGNTVRLDRIARGLHFEFSSHEIYESYKSSSRQTAREIARVRYSTLYILYIH